jgi:hypothetical protein
MERRATWSSAERHYPMWCVPPTWKGEERGSPVPLRKDGVGPGDEWSWATVREKERGGMLGSGWGLG